MRRWRRRLPLRRRRHRALRKAPFTHHRLVQRIVAPSATNTSTASTKGHHRPRQRRRRGPPWPMHTGWRARHGRARTAGGRRYVLGAVNVGEDARRGVRWRGDRRCAVARARKRQRAQLAFGRHRRRKRLLVLGRHHQIVVPFVIRVGSDIGVAGLDSHRRSNRRHVVQ